MELRKASRKAVKIKIGIGGPAGSGKTYSALKMAYGLCGDWEKICVVDAENGSAELYSDLGPYWVIPLNTDFSPQNYINAINACVKNGIEVIILDGITPEWEYLLELQNKFTEADPRKNSYTSWAKITPLHNDFKNAILQAPVHVISTVRKKQEHVMVNENGRTRVEKLGLADITRDGWDYEVTVNFNLDTSHLAVASKDRTNLFIGEDILPFTITEETGKQIKDWCESGASDKETFLNNAKIEVNNSSSLEELNFIYNKYSDLKTDKDFLAVLGDKKKQFIKS